MDVAASFEPTPAQRARVAESSQKVLWLTDLPDAKDADLSQVRVLVSLYPQRELRRLGLAWEAMPRLELVQLLSAGANHVGWRRLPAGVHVATAGGATGAAIAEYVLGAVIAWCRGFQAHTEAMRSGHFDMAAPALSLQGLSVGVLGHGGIGSATTKLLARMGCAVGAVSRHKPSGDHLEWAGTLEQVPELAARSQVLVVALPHVRATEGIVDRDILDAMPMPSLLVNVARGPVVDRAALDDWLSEPGRWAHLDVWWDYGGAWRPPFQHRNITMTPHNSSSVPGHREAMLAKALENVRGFLSSGTAQYVQDPADYD